jgi:hypothetical protein
MPNEMRIMNLTSTELQVKMGNAATSGQACLRDTTAKLKEAQSRLPTRAELIAEKMADLYRRAYTAGRFMPEASSTLGDKL